MRLLRRLALFLAFAMPVALLAAALLTIEGTPSVDQSTPVTLEHIARAKHILDLHNVRRKPGALATITVRADDVSVATNYLARHVAHGSSRVALGPGSARVEMSLPLERGPVRGFVNVRTTLRETQGLPRLHDTHIGRLALPDWMANALAGHALQWARRNPHYREGVQAVRGLYFSPQALRVVYAWQKDLPARLGGSVASAENVDALRPYQERLAELSGAGARVSLARLSGPMFSLAMQRTAAGEDAVEASRAVLLVLTMHALDQPLSSVSPAAKGWKRPRPQVVTLAGREDTARHFLVSAALAAFADTALADVIGVYKELSDSRGGSGFSFNDLTADRAGTRLGERAADTRSAAALQARIAAGVAESDLLPRIDDLPENMPEAEFNRRFGGVNGPEYLRMLAEIERRLDGVALLRTQ